MKKERLIGYTEAMDICQCTASQLSRFFYHTPEYRQKIVLVRNQKKHTESTINEIKARIDAIRQNK